MTRTAHLRVFQKASCWLCQCCQGKSAQLILLVILAVASGSASFSSLTYFPSTGPESGTNTHGHATRTRVQKRKRTTITGQTAEGLLAEAAFRENPGQRAGWDLQRRGSLSSWGLLPEQRHTVGRALDPGAYSAMTHFKDSKPIS